jgi:hypothetical protein
VVAPAAAGFDDQVFAAQLAQVVGALPDCLVGVPGHRLDLGGEVFDGEPAGGGGQREHGVECCAGAGLV